MKHLVNHHNIAMHDFKFSHYGSWKTRLERQLQDAIKIEQTPNEVLMNSKAEWGNNSIPRTTIHQDSARAEERQGVKRIPAPQDPVLPKLEVPQEGQRLANRMRKTEENKELSWSASPTPSSSSSSVRGSN